MRFQPVGALMHDEERVCNRVRVTIDVVVLQHLSAYSAAPNYGIES